MSITKTFTAAALGAALVSTTAMAEISVNSSTTIESLPKEGIVQLSGTVDTVSNAKEFTLSDATGKTIDVDATTAMSLKKGDHVNVSGTMDDEFLGMGREINGATVTVISAAPDAPETTAGKTAAAASLAGGAPSAKLAMTADNEAKYNTAKNVSDNGATNAYTESMKHPERTRIDLDLDADVDTVKADATAKSAIDALPQEGPVTISGMVDTVDTDDKTFVLRDASGKTIDVHTSSKVMLQKGQTVKVSGTMSDEALGLGEEIVSARVQVLR